MTCEHYQQQTSALLDGEASPESSAPLFAHLAGCENCRTFFLDLTALNEKVELHLRKDEPLVTAGPQLHAPTRPRMTALWQRRIRVPLSVVAVAITVVISLACWSLMTRIEQAPPQRIYVSTLPVVEVTAN